MSIANVSTSSNDDSKSSEIARIMGLLDRAHHVSALSEEEEEEHNDVPRAICSSLEMPKNLLFPELSDDDAGRNEPRTYKLPYRPQTIRHTTNNAAICREASRSSVTGPPGIRLIEPVLFQDSAPPPPRPREGILSAIAQEDHATFHFDPDEDGSSSFRYTANRRASQAPKPLHRPLPLLFGLHDDESEMRERNTTTLQPRQDGHHHIAVLSPLHMVHPTDVLEEESPKRRPQTPCYQPTTPTIFRSPTGLDISTTNETIGTPTSSSNNKADYGIPMRLCGQTARPSAPACVKKGYIATTTTASCIVSPGTNSSDPTEPELSEGDETISTMTLSRESTRDLELGGQSQVAETPPAATPNTQHNDGVARRRKSAAVCNFRILGRLDLKRLFKYLYSVLLLAFSIWLVVGVIVTEKARLAKDPHPVATFCATWFLLIWLATMEGGQGCLIGLQRVDKRNYARTHPMALRCTTLAHKGDNMERFIVGRQFMVFIVVFLTNMFKVMNVPDDEVLDVFLTSGQFWSAAAIILTTITAGQLSAQVHAANCMLDFVNSRAMLFTTYVALLIENTGILHSAYLVQIVFSKIAGTPIETREKRTTFQKIFFWTRIFMSLALLYCSLVVTLSAMFQNKTTQWKWVPGSVSVVLFFLVMGFVGMFEALQIALFEVIHMPDEYFDNDADKTAKANCDLAFKATNLQAILIGRQICVTTGVFAIARMTTPTLTEDDMTVYGNSPTLLQFFNTGLLGAFITTIVASLSWRIVAASFPLAFLNNPMMKHIIDLCLLLENSGICSSSWIFGLFHKAIAGLRGDEEYLGRRSFNNNKSSSTIDDDDDDDDGDCTTANVETTRMTPLDTVV